MSLPHTVVDDLVETLQSIQEPGSLFLVEITTSALSGEGSRYTLQDICIALEKSECWEIVDPLHLFPLLLGVPLDGAAKLIHLVAQRANAKECVIAIQEGIDNFDHFTSEKKGSSEVSLAEQLVRLLDATSECIPRLQLRKKGPAETLRSIFKHLGTAVELVALQTNKQEGREILEESNHLVCSIVSWVSDVKWHKLESPTVSELLSDFIISILGVLSSKICSSLAERRFAVYYPRFAFNMKISEDAFKGSKIMQDFISTIKKLGLTLRSLNSRPHLMGKLILLAHLAHEEPNAVSTSNRDIEDLVPSLVLSLRQNTAVDETLSLLLTLICSSTDTLTESIIDPLTTTLTPFSASHSDPTMRHISFRILSATLRRSPSPLRLAHLTSLLSDCPFMQMRVAAVGLVKEAFLHASTADPSSLFNSPSLIRAVGPILFRPEPLNVFEKPSLKSLENFVESSESVRLTECLSFYYVWLTRDIKNLTGIRDSDRMKNVETGLLRPLRDALFIWSEELSISPKPHLLMALASLQTSIERVDNAVSHIAL